MVEKSLCFKSYLFEVRDKTGEQVEGFTLTVPPESVSIEEPQRLSETKTFGGIFTDDYGPDVYNIIISGNTGGSSVRKSYNVEDSEFGEFNGKSAFFNFRNSIMRYKKSYPDDFSEYTMKIFDLSGLPDNFIKGPVENIAEGYEVNLRRFRMERNKDKPLWYNYSIEMTGIRELGTYSASTSSPVEVQSAFNLVSSLRRGLRLIQNSINTIKSIADEIASSLDLLTQITSEIDNFTKGVGDIIQYPTKLAKKLSTDLKKSATDIDSSYTYLKSIGMPDKIYFRLLQDVREMQAAAASLVFLGISLSSGSMVKKITSLASRSTSGVLRNISESNVSLIEDMSPLGSLSEDRKVVIYGYRMVRIEEGFTFRNVAIKYMGSPNYSETIAELNSMKENQDLIVGNYLKVPVLSIGKKSLDNRVYTEDRDILGSDVKMSDSGSVSVTVNGDWSTIEGSNNITQAVNLRLNEILGSRLHLSIYGIKAAIGGASSNRGIIGYGLASINDTLIQDPRVAKLKNMKIWGNGDTIGVSMDIYTIKLGNKIPFKGEI